MTTALWQNRSPLSSLKQPKTISGRGMQSPEIIIAEFQNRVIFYFLLEVQDKITWNISIVLAQFWLCASKSAFLSNCQKQKLFHLISPLNQDPKPLRASALWRTADHFSKLTETTHTNVKGRRRRKKRKKQVTLINHKFAISQDIHWTLRRKGKIKVNFSLWWPCDSLFEQFDLFHTQTCIVFKGLWKVECPNHLSVETGSHLSSVMANRGLCEPHWNVQMNCVERKKKKSMPVFYFRWFSLWKTDCSCMCCRNRDVFHNRAAVYSHFDCETFIFF